MTITLETASGTLVPAARNVRPITESGISSVSPITFKHYSGEGLLKSLYHVELITNSVVL